MKMKRHSCWTELPGRTNTLSQHAITFEGLNGGATGKAKGADWAAARIKKPKIIIGNRKRSYFKTLRSKNFRFPDEKLFSVF